MHASTPFANFAPIAAPTGGRESLIVTVSAAGSGVAAALVARVMGEGAKALYCRPDREFPLQAAGLYYSVAHTADLTVLAIDVVPIGVDVEKVMRVDLVEDMAWALTPDELSELAESEDPRLTEIWTAKEAAGKALGTGLAAQPRCFRTIPGELGAGVRLARAALPCHEETPLFTAGWWLGDHHIRVAWAEATRYPSEM